MSVSTATASDPHEHVSHAASAPLLGVFLQVSVALALVLFVRDVLALAPLDRALLTAAGAGVVLYASLVGGYFLVRRILEMPSEAPAADAEPAPAAEAESSSEVPAEAVAA